MRRRVFWSALCLVIGPVGAHAANPPIQTVNINTASAQEISARLDGIGPSKAAAIVLHRKRFGAFKEPNDLAHVDGISPVTLHRITPYVRLVDAPSPIVKTSVSLAELSAH
jgi:competence protein ComEA